MLNHEVFPEGFALTLPGVLDRSVALFGDREGYVEGELRLTFGELVEQIDEVARAFIAAGVGHGDRICVWAPNGLRWLLAAFGAYRIGAVLVPLNTRFKGPEAAHVLRTSGARMLFTVTDFLDTNYPQLLVGNDSVDTLENVVVMSGPVADGCRSWQDFVESGASISAAAVSVRSSAVVADDLSDIMFTSGTTGKPKGAMLRHGATVVCFEAWASVVGLNSDDRFLILNPFFHTFGLKAGLVAALIKGATIVPQAVFDVPLAMRTIAAERITMLPGPPAIYQTMLDHPELSSFDLSSLRLAVTGAAMVPVELVRQIRDVLGFETVVTGYGLTESTGVVTMCRHDDTNETIAHTAGRPLAGVEIRLVDSDGEEVAIGQPGEILVRGYNVMAGYFGDDEATRATIDPDGWLSTGDVGVQDLAGNVRITDRKKDMYIVGGFNAYPAEIEDVLTQYPGVGQVAVVGVPDRRLGEVGMAFIVPRRGETVLEAEVLRWCRERMANYKVPRYVRSVTELPLNASGKVLKFQLRQLGSAERSEAN